MSETLQLRGTLIGHNGWVTQIATNPKDPDTIISASRGECFLLWRPRESAGVSRISGGC